MKSRKTSSNIICKTQKKMDGAEECCEPFVHLQVQHFKTHHAFLKFHMLKMEMRVCAQIVHNLILL